MSFDMHDLSKLDERQRRICREALRRTDFPFDQSPLIVDVLALKIADKYAGRSAGGQFHPPRGPLELDVYTLTMVEYGISTFAHESGHAVDFLMLNDDQRVQIRRLFGAPDDAPWLEPATYTERVGEAFAEAFSHAYFDVVGGVDRYAWRMTSEVLRGIRALLTPDLPPEKPSELAGSKLVKLVVKYRDGDGNSVVDTLVRPTTRRRLDFYTANDLPIRKMLDSYRRRKASIEIVSVRSRA